MCRKSFEKTLGGYYIMNENKECMYKKGDCMVQEERPCSEEFLKKRQEILNFLPFFYPLLFFIIE